MTATITEETYEQFLLSVSLETVADLPVIHRAMDYNQEKLYASVAVPQAHVRDPLVPSITSVG